MVGDRRVIDGVTTQAMHVSLYFSCCLFRFQMICDRQRDFASAHTLIGITMPAQDTSWMLSGQRSAADYPQARRDFALMPRILRAVYAMMLRHDCTLH